MSVNPPGAPHAEETGRAAAAEAERLEAALDRIERAAGRRASAARRDAAIGRAPDTAAIAARLDRLIADLRGLLGT